VIYPTQDALIGCAGPNETFRDQLREQSDTTTAFVAEAEGKRLKIRAADPEADKLVDLETHSTWNAYGECVAGRMKGTRLKLLILEPEFWFAWSEFRPKTLLYGWGSTP
jgi:hypothetical protein